MAQALSGAILGDVRARPPTCVRPWMLSSREARFARSLLTGSRTNLWLFRTDQKRRAGDFAVLDLSSPDPALRTLWVMDLKCGAPLTAGGGGAGNQLQNAGLVAQYLADHGWIAPSTAARLLVGDGRVLLEHLGG